MRNLLILTLVLGMASVANAVVVGLSVDGVNVSDGTEDILQNTTIELSVVCDTADYPWIMEVSVLKADATLGIPIPWYCDICPPPPDYSDEIWWCYELSTGGVPGYPPPVGQQWTMDLSSSLSIGSVFTFYLGPYGIPPVSTIDFTVVPEPVTIALLGLGGLFLMRRRK
ncbi:MAG: PEP-CTERM sorting domain-containing protein [Sedimentisphaerales bacterium]